MVTRSAKQDTTNAATADIVAGSQSDMVNASTELGVYDLVLGLCKRDRDTYDQVKKSSSPSPVSQP